MNRYPLPLWIKIIIILAMLPLLAYPSLLSTSGADHQARVFIYLYPAYVIASGICAWICWPTRPEVSWILLFLMVLTHIAIWML